MLGAEKEIIARYVTTGQVKIVFWPITDLGARSVDAAAIAVCAGEQNPSLFWRVHDTLFENARETYRGDRAYFIDTATAVGADRDEVVACFDGGAAHDLVRELDRQRQDAGILQRPTFDINGERLVGSVLFDTFDQAIQQALP